MSKKIPCVGHLSTGEILSTSGLKFSDFNGKAILDLGCGLSDFLGNILDSSEPEKLVGVDPIFETPETLKTNMAYTRQYIAELIQGSQDQGIREKLLTRKASLGAFSIKSKVIDYRGDIRGLRPSSFDYIFVSFVLSHLSDMHRRDLIQQIDFFKKSTGKSCIIDIHPTVEEVKGILGRGRLKVLGNGISCLRI